MSLEERLTKLMQKYSAKNLENLQENLNKALENFEEEALIDFDLLNEILMELEERGDALEDLIEQDIIREGWYY